MAGAVSSVLVGWPLCPAGCTAIEGMEQSSIWGCYPGFGAPHAQVQAARLPPYPSFCVESGWGVNGSLSVQMSLLILILLSLPFPFMDAAGGVGGAMSLLHPGHPKHCKGHHCPQLCEVPALGTARPGPGNPGLGLALASSFLGLRQCDGKGGP